MVSKGCPTHLRAFVASDFEHGQRKTRAGVQLDFCAGIEAVAKENITRGK